MEKSQILQIKEALKKEEGFVPKCDRCGVALPRADSANAAYLNNNKTELVCLNCFTESDKDYIIW